MKYISIAIIIFSLFGFYLNAYAMIQTYSNYSFSFMFIHGMNVVLWVNVLKQYKK
jgi:hypothetical protein